MAKTNQNNKYIPNELIVEIFKATNKNTTKIKQLEDKLENQIIMKNINGIAKTTKQIFEIYCIYAKNFLNSSSICYKFCSQNFVKIKQTSAGKKVEIAKMQILQSQLKIGSRVRVLPRDKLKREKITTDRDARQFGNRFIPLTNSWHSVDELFTCCPSKCINSNIHSGQCENNGYIRVMSDVVKYFSTNIDARNKFIKIYAQSPFRKEAGYQGGYCFYYFEASMIEIANRESSSLFVGVKNDDIEVGVMFDGNEISVIHNQRGQIRSQHNWSSNDVIGVGLVFPPGGQYEEPHLFFTLNGSKIGKAVVLMSGYDNNNFFPTIHMESCTVRTNFGNSFVYNVGEHISHGQVYSVAEWESLG